MIKLTNDRCADYVWFAQFCIDKQGVGRDVYVDGRTLVICQYDEVDATLILIEKGDFIYHPRSGSLRKFTFSDSDGNSYYLTGVTGGGYSFNGDSSTELSATDAYTLIDFDKGSFVLSSDGNELVSEWAESDENYGNLYWIGEGDEPEVLSWRGCPSVQFPVDSKYTIPGLSQKIFDVWIYQDGQRLCHGPQVDPDDETKSLVVGAVLLDPTLIAIVMSVTTNGPRLQIYKTVDVGKNWVLISEFEESNHRTPAFISKSGLTFVYGNKRYEINSNLDSVTKVEEQNVADTFSETVVGAGGYNSDYIYSGKQRLYPNLDSTNKLKFATVETTAKFIHKGAMVDISDYASEVVPVYRGNPATSVSLYKDSFQTPPCTISGDGYLATFVANANGSYCKMVWSGVHCYKDNMAAVKIPDCGASFSVTVTLQPQGVSATFTQDAIESDMEVTGPQNSGNISNPGITQGQYGVRNAYGAVTWSISCGTITENGYAEFSGCACPEDGLVTITATDECGRTASLSVLAAASGGYWVSNNDRCCMSYIPDELKWMHCAASDEGSGCDTFVRMEGTNRVTYAIYPAWILWLYTWEELCGNGVCSGSWDDKSLLIRNSDRWECP